MERFSSKIGVFSHPWLPILLSLSIGVLLGIVISYGFFRGQKGSGAPWPPRGEQNEAT